MEQVSREDFAEFVLNMRNALGMNRPCFSRISGISPRTIASWEKQSVNPREIEDKVIHIREVVKSELQRRREAGKERRNRCIKTKRKRGFENEHRGI